MRTVPHVFERSGSAKKCGFGYEPKRKGKELIYHNFLEKMCNANNFISSVQTSGVRIRIF